SAWASHAAVRAGTAEHAARESVVGCYAEAVGERWTRHARSFLRGEEPTYTHRKCRAGASDCGCSGGIISLQRFGFRRDRSDCGEGAGGNLHLYTKFSRNAVRRSTTGPQHCETLRDKASRSATGRRRNRVQD